MSCFNIRKDSKRLDNSFPAPVDDLENSFSEYHPGSSVQSGEQFTFNNERYSSVGNEVDSPENDDLSPPNPRQSKVGGRIKEDAIMRKRSRNSDKWQRNIRRQNRTSGKSYMSTTGKLIAERVLKPPCSCRRKCYISETDRQMLFSKFYKLPKDAQNQFVSDNVTENNKKTERLCSGKQESRRRFTRQYTLQGTEICQKMFLNTLDITLMRIRVALNKRRE